MLYSALAFLAGVGAVQALPVLPTARVWWLAAILPTALLPRRCLRAVCAATAGFLYCSWHAGQLLAIELPARFEGKDLLVQGVIAGLPEGRGSTRLRFRFDVRRFRGDAGWRKLSLPARISWYRQAPDLQPGQRWQLVLRLKRPRALANPAGFDYARWLFAQRIRATGYVRAHDENRLLPGVSGGWIGRCRQRLSRRIEAAAQDSETAGLLAALGVGDRSGMSSRHWDVLRSTGTGHLMAISGLHVGLVASLVFVLVRRCWGRFGNPLRWPAPSAAAVAAMAAATVYALLAGFQVPAQRALVMVCLWMSSVLWTGRPAPWRVWAAALWIVLLRDPLAVLGAGFWLSFGAVAWILYLARSRVGRTSGLREMLGVQLALVLGLTPLLWIWFQQASPVAPLANLVAIPWISFLVVPLVLVSLVTLPLLPVVGEPVLRLAEQLVGLLWQALEWLAALPAALVSLPAVPLPLLVLFGVALLLILAPRGVPLRTVGAVLAAPALLWAPQRPPPGDVWLILLDVGQGLSAVVETHRHVLVYDAGPAFSQGFDSGQAVVVPYLEHRGYRRVDRLVISHSDNDHLGGGEAVFRSLDVQAVQSGEPAAIAWSRSTLCRAGQDWLWDGVRFRYLAPARRRGGNNASCVLRIETADGRAVLLPGDIERTVEKDLLASQPRQLDAQVLVAPHHGSRTSSTGAFIRAVGPEYVLFAVGYRNRFGFPKRDVVDRYLEAGARVLDTASSGAIQVRMEAGRRLAASGYRATARRYWHRSGFRIAP